MQTRADFLTRAGTLLLGALAISPKLPSAEPSVAPGNRPFGRGKPQSKVRRWDVITIGNLSRNRYWGESDAQGVRSAICTCTLITGEGFRLLVDPSLADPAQMTKELDRRSGAKLSDISAVFITHEHQDHWAGLAHFPDAQWFATAPVAEILNRSNRFSRKIEPAPAKLFDAIEVLPTPGHTTSHHSLRFDCEGLSIVIAGDAVATRDFWRERRGYFNCVDFELSAKSMEKIAGMADIIVPGHDNYFLNPM